MNFDLDEQWKDKTPHSLIDNSEQHTNGRRP